MAALKAKVAVAALKEDNTLAKLAEKYDLHANQIAQWRTQLIEAATGLVPAPVEKGPSASARDTQAKIGQLALEMILWPARSVASMK